MFQVPSCQNAANQSPQTWNLESGTWNHKSGFTLLELLVALTILVFAFAIIWETFSGTVKAWQKGSQLLDELRHGDFVMEQLVSALRSAAFFKTSPGRYGFRLETGNAGSYPGDKLSWVTISSAFIPPDSELSQGTHRIIFSIEDNDDGKPAVCIRAYDPLLEDEDTVKIDRWFVSTEVQGIQCRVYNVEENIWENSWEGELTNSLPTLVEITLFMNPIEKFGEPVTLKQVVEIPIAPAVTNRVETTDTTSASTDDPANQNPSKTPRSSQSGTNSLKTGNSGEGASK
jgi:prepilin-type N-terminal cleavage/methylation domain-containing protein